MATNEVIKNLLIGDFEDAKNFPTDPRNLSINVAFEHQKTLPNSLYLPWFAPVDNEHFQVNGLVLNAVVEIIEANRRLQRAVLVNCNMGMERAPLTVVWYLMKKEGATLESAYRLVKAKRPQTLDRREWLKGLIEI